MKHKQIGSIVLIAGILIVLILATLYLQMRKKDVSRTAGTGLTPTITPIPIITTSPNPTQILEKLEEYSKKQRKADEETAALFEREKQVGKLLFVVPYKGVNFSITHDYNRAVFVVIIPKGKESEGNQEFDTFLKKNGVEDRSWIRKELLEIRYE